MDGVVAAVPGAVIVSCAEEFKVCGVLLHEDWPAVAAMTYAACTVRLPGALLVSTPLPNVANELLEIVHCVLEVTSCVVPSLRCALACRVAAPPTVTVAGVTLTDSEFRLDCEEGFPHAVNRRNRPLSSAKRRNSIGGTHILYLVHFEASRPGDKATARA